MSQKSRTDSFSATVVWLVLVITECPRDGPRTPAVIVSYRIFYYQTYRSVKTLYGARPHNRFARRAVARFGRQSTTIVLITFVPSIVCTKCNRLKTIVAFLCFRLQNVGRHGPKSRFYRIEVMIKCRASNVFFVYA